MISRRLFLKLTAATGVLGLSGSAYATLVEPMLSPRLRRYDVHPKRWPSDLTLSIAVVADLHSCKPWMDLPRIEKIVAQTNALGADLIVLLGDFITGHRFVTGPVEAADWSRALAQLKAPLGVHAVLGNHDWWQDADAMRRQSGPTFVRLALEKVGIPVYENDVTRLTKDGRSFWLAGLGDQIAFEPAFRRGEYPRRGVDDLDATLAKVPPGEPLVLMAHEPDVMARIDDRVSLLLSGHTHGGQVRLFGWSPIVPSRFGNRYAYGHVRERCDLIVSGGLGCSIMPIRFGMPPELVMVRVSADGASPPMASQS